MQFQYTWLGRFEVKKKELFYESFFKVAERGSSVKTEFIAGMTTFFAMVYILMVNANMFSDPFGDGSNPLGVSYGAIYISTAIPAFLTLAVMPFTYNISYGIAFGLISYIIISVFCGDFKKTRVAHGLLPPFLWQCYCLHIKFFKNKKGSPTAKRNRRAFIFAYYLLNPNPMKFDEPKDA